MPSDEEVLDRAAVELERVLAALEQCRDDHRRVDAVLGAVLERLPVPIVVLDDRGVVRAASAAAEERWRVAVDSAATTGLPTSPAGDVAFDDPAGGQLRLVWDD